MKFFNFHAGYLTCILFLIFDFKFSVYLYIIYDYFPYSCSKDYAKDICINHNNFYKICIDSSADWTGGIVSSVFKIP